MLSITSTMKFGELPGNVILRKGEANLPKKCVINVTQIKSVDKSSIKEKIGTLSNKKMDEVHEGLKLVMRPDLEQKLGSLKAVKLGKQGR